MANYREQAQWTAEQALAYIVNLEAADQENQYHAFATAYNYFNTLMKKKISWSVHLEKLAYEFIELAFNSNKHSSIKDMLKSYRSLTQGQYSQSLKDVLEHYRDRKLEVILEQDILHENIDLIRNLPNIQNQEASSTMIFSSFRPEQKRKLQELRHKLKIVWDGYKFIIDIVRVNQKLEDVFKETLGKVFTFVEKFNRKHQFKSFCRTLRSGLMNAFNKRDRSEQQKAIYIDIEKSDVNDRNIEIRLEQFKVTIKLGLWQQSFQVLQDINNLMKVRKGALKSNIRYKYYENLALLFKKSNYWHYHAFAFYNKFLAAKKNPKLTAKQRKQLSDKLLLSVLCIPPVTLESNQNKQSQLKISSMMISSTKIPSKKEMFDIIVSDGISENASSQIRNLWNFMFEQFNLESLGKGLQILNKITNEDYLQFKTLIEDILIYKQLQSISEIYQRIKIDSLLSLIPLARQKIERILLSSYHQKILDFVLDEHQKIIIFQDKSSQKSSNPTENFLSIYIDLAIEKEKQRKDDGKHILNKLENFVETAEQYFWTIREFKINQYKKKLKKPKQQLLNEVHRRKLLQKEERQKLEAEKMAKQSEALRMAEQKKKQFGTKKIIINDIKEIKQARVVRILGKKIEQLTDEQIQNISIETLNNHLEQIKTKIQNNREAKYKKAFNQIDYAQRQRRQRLVPKIQELIPSNEAEQENFDQIKKKSKAHHEDQRALKQTISKMMTYLKPKIQDETKRLEEKYDQQMIDFKQRIADYYKQKIIARAKALAKQNKQKKQQEQKLMREAQYQYAGGAKWTFKGVNRVAGTEPTVQKTQAPKITIGLGRKTEEKSSSFQVQQSGQQKPTKWGRKVIDQQQKREQAPVSNQNNQKWGRKQQVKQQQTIQQPVQQASTNSFVPPPPVQKKTFGMGIGFGKKTVQVPKKEEPKKDDGKPRGPAKKYVNVN